MVRLVFAACAVAAFSLSAFAQPPRRTAVPTLTIGADDSKGDNYSLAQIEAVASSNDGRIFVLDYKDCVIKVFSPTGTYLQTIGRRGAGPGEFTRPRAMLLSDSDVMVRDGSERLVRFSLDGKPTTTTVDTAAAFTSAVYALPHGLNLRVHTASISSGSGKPDASPYTTLALERRAARVDTLARIRSGAVYWLANGSFGAMSSPFGEGGGWALSRDTLLAVVDGYAGTATWYTFSQSGARVARTATVGPTARPITSSELRAMEADFRATLAKALGAPDVKFIEPPTHHSVATKAIFDQAQGLWVSGPPTANKTIVWTVFPANGRSFVVEVPADFTLSSVRGDLLFGKSIVDELPVVKVYRLGQ